MKKTKINLKNVATIVVCFAVSMMLIFMSCEKENSKKTGPGKVALKGIKFNKSEIYIPVGDTYILELMPVPTNASLPVCNYFSDDKDIATVNSYGKVTAISAGETTITATTNNGKFAAECTVIVTKSGGGDELTYRDPYLKFGGTKSAVKNYETRDLFQEDENNLDYDGENDDVYFVLYHFEENKLLRVYVVFNQSSNIETRAKNFLSKKYIYKGMVNGEHNFQSSDGKIQVILFDDEEYGWSVYYGENSSKSGTKTMKKHFIPNNIKRKY